MKVLCRRQSSYSRRRLELNLSVIVCINKIDRPEARPNEVIDEVLELFIDLDANEDQLGLSVCFCFCKNQDMPLLSLNDERKDMQPLFDCIVNHIPAPEGDPDDRYTDARFPQSTTTNLSAVSVSVRLKTVSLQRQSGSNQL